MLHQVADLPDHGVGAAHGVALLPVREDGQQGRPDMVLLPGVDGLQAAEHLDQLDVVVDEVRRAEDVLAERAGEDGEDGGDPHLFGRLRVGLGERDADGMFEILGGAEAGPAGWIAENRLVEILAEMFLGEFEDRHPNRV